MPDGTVSKAATRSNDVRPRPRYIESLRRAVRDPAELLRRVGLADGPEGRRRLAEARVAASSFRVMVPESYLARMAYGDPDDPLLRQVLPVGDEQADRPDFVDDPVGDGAVRAAPGLLHKYEGRVLLVTTGACAVHCRYCFRRHYPYADEPGGAEAWRPAFDYVAADRSVREVILSGGDPLMLSDGRLEEMFARIDAIGHVERVRLHSRLPIVLPDRVTDRLLDLFASARPRVVFVTHANHARELMDDCADALRRLSASTATVLNQAVLLRQVNDSVDALANLSERLFDHGVLPYYLHQLDRVAGAAHFEVPERVGLDLVERLRGRLPGYLVPTYVRETAGEPSNTPVE
ncbi:MAG: EF-P beta-lysylation protein EpmB [Planctomycetota bacterium]